MTSSCSPPLPYAHHHTYRWCTRYSHFTPIPISTHYSHSLIYHRSSSPFNLHRSFLTSPSHPNRSFYPPRSGIPDPPPGQPDPSPNNPPPVRLSGVTTTLSKVRDTVQVFLAVLFWMSLFFWASAWDGNNTGRGNKRNNFRK